jgi:pyruvate dehydrogenase E2 component (dihydrolipoamide acetyltransferase)
MAFPLYVPRLNNNDDTVRLNAFLVEVGAKLRKGDPVADIETDKATFTVEAEEDGYILALEGLPGSILNVGATLAWMGAEATEKPPSSNGTGSLGSHKSRAEPTLKALLLLARLGLSADQVPASGERLSIQDVENYARRNGLGAKVQPTVTAKAEPAPNVEGHARELTAEERGMLRTVEWQRDHAVPGYVELSYDAEKWNEYAVDFQQRNKLLISPLLALQAWRLAQAARRMPKLNSTLVDGKRYEYGPVNLGFTVQSGEFLFIVVIERADSLDEKQFFDRLNELQRAAMKHSLKPNESSGNTITFTSMARWRVARHMPVLPPQTSLVVAHSAPANSVATIGATYDHRVLSGFDAVQALQATVRIEQDF